MLSQGCDRGTVVVAFGGGVVGDLAGFVAATYMRGIKFVQIPTTLLAMNDSSIGGKTGIDAPAGKNLVGAFHRPVRVYIDVSLLKTLPKREMSNGMAEVIKHAAIRSTAMFSELQMNAELIMGKDPAALLSIIHQSVVIKTTVVIQDEKEGGLRAILNFGHSVGHGIEAIMAPGWLHGECVSVGMIKETEIARGRGELAPDALGRLLSCCQAYGLPVKMPAEAHPKEVLRRMACDKKNKNGTKYIVMLKSVGDSGNGAHPVEDDDILRVLSPGVQLIPGGALSGTIKVPGSKSISNRILLMTALGRGSCVIKGLLHSDDTGVMMEALQALGVCSFEWKDGGKTLIVTGVDGDLKAPPAGTEVYLANAGTASRFLTTSVILAAGKMVHLTGNKRMKERPIGPLVDALRQIGCSVDYTGTEGCLPLDVGCGGLPGGTVNLSATISSQYVSSVLIAAPYAKKPTRLQLNGKAVSPTYIDMTISLMKIYGVEVEREGEGTYIIPNCGYNNPTELIVESDASSASYPLALAAITGGEVTVDGIGTTSLQGDAKFCEVLRQMGCEVDQTETKTTVKGPKLGSLKPIVVDMESVTDTFMTAAAVMATANGTSRIYNIANQRVKECDRIAATVAELRRCGVVARELPDGLEIDGVTTAPVLSKPAEINCYKDHRIAMSFGVLGSAWPSLQIMDKDCTDKTFPSFWHDLELVFDVKQLPWNTPEKVGRVASDTTTQAVKKCRTGGLSPIAQLAHSMTPCNGYDVAVGQDFLQRVPEDVLALTNATTYVVITDDHLKKLYQVHLEAAFEGLKTENGAAVKVLWYSVAPGEPSKCRATKVAIEDWMLSQGCDRGTVVVAFGGGVVGDLAGFVAATYMRGIKFVQIPTTLLAMNDSSIGGKTGIDAPAGKNLVGAFHRPVRVYIDVSLLKTLPKREMSNGMAEVIKHAAIRSTAMFSELQMNAELIMGKDPAALLSIIHQSVVIKTTVVIQDEKEGGLRAILNFGHSVGHGIEAIMAPGWLHGECVSVGMIKETEIARGRGELAPDALGRLLSCCQAYGLPVKMPAEAHPKEVLRRMACDKKNKNGTKYIVMLKSVGDSGNGAHPVEDDDILRVLSPGVQLIPGGALSGTIKVPGSKSISNRILLMTALGRGSCVIKGLLHSDDTGVMMEALQALGVCSFEWKDGGKTLIVTGVDGDLKAPPAGTEVYLANAGTASRFLTTSVILAAGKMVHLTGNKRMKERPIGPLVDALRQIGCSVDYTGTEGCLPLDVGCGGLPGGTVNLSATISSQYVSSVLIAAPYAKKPTRLQLNGKAVSPTYIDMTISLMKIYGVEVEREGEGTYIIPNCGYNNPTELIVESDASSASYPLALAAITGGEVTVDGIGTTSLQGDAKFCEVLRQMGCEVDQTETKTTVKGPKLGSLKPIVVDMESVTDTFMTAAAVMATANGTSRIYNIANQRVKECDRIAATVAELRRCGVVARELPDGLEIDGVTTAPVLSKPAEINCYKDHRIAMSFGVLGSAWPSLQIMDKDCTDKTFPSFWHDLELVFDVKQLPWNTPEKVGRSKGKQSAFIIGMRAAGKTTLGKNSAAFFSSNFIDLDAQIEDIQGLVKREGWPAFRAKETQTLKDAIAKVSTDQSNWIISCGGGIVEAEENQALLKQCGFPVVWVKREINDIERFLNKDGSRPAYGESITDVFKRRIPKYAACSTVEFCPDSVDSLSTVQGDFNSLMGQVLGHTVPSLRGDSCVASITAQSVEKVDPAVLAAISMDVQAVELRIDLFQNLDVESVHTQVRLAKRLCAKPIVFCVLPESCGGNFKGSEADYWKLLEAGLRAGCEYVEVQVCYLFAA